MPEPFNAAFIAKVKADIEQVTVEKQRQIGLIAFSEVVQETPVDTGQARGGWRLVGGERSYNNPGPQPKGSELAPPKIELTGKQQIVLGESIFLTNGVEHIVYLNEGTSENAPPQFIEQSLVRAVNKAKKL